MGFYIILGILCFIGVGMIMADDSDKQDRLDHIALLIDIRNFMSYCEKHKDELPENIRERYDELNETYEKGDKLNG